MFCIKCGANNLDDAAYCQKCGELLVAEEETRVAPRKIPGSDSGDETHLVIARPTMKFVKAGYVTAAVGALVLVGLLSAFMVWVPAWTAVLIGLLLLLIPAYFHFRQKLIRYTLTDSKLEIDSGLISRTTRNIPLTRIQDVTVSSTLSQRLLGFGNVVIDNASEEGGKIVLRNIDSPRKFADSLLSQMRRLDQ
jgi:Predicted membrane protein